MSSIPFTDTIQPDSAPISAWSSLLSSSLQPLRQLAGTTEREFLQIGSQMQGIYQQALLLSQTAHQLVEVASGEHIHAMVARLRQILREMENYLGQAQEQSSNSCATLDAVQLQLKKVGAPLEGVKKMSKHLYIFEVSIKIESAYLGDMGNEFINLAMDIKKLSQQIKEKVNSIHNHRLRLTGIIGKNSVDIHEVRATQEAKAQLTLENTVTSLSELEAINDRFSLLGGSISAIAEENSEHISGIVQSMQFHDIYRQQVEHVIEALEGLIREVPADSPGDDQAVIGRIGDVCELQEAQLQFASAELYTAVTSIVANLQDIGSKQKEMARDIYAQTSADEASGSSFIENVSRRMSSIADLLTSCAGSNSRMAVLMQEVTGTVSEITSFVSDIEEIGQEIIQIALNARIKASCTGKNGASLSVLAEEIGQLSNDAVQRTDLITATLTEIDAVTAVLAGEVTDEGAVFGERLTDMKGELNKVLGTLEGMGGQLFSLLARTRQQVDALTREIERITGGIHVHERTKTMADDVLGKLKDVFLQARAFCPASSAFKEDLLQMGNRYTMESERRIHEDIAGRHGMQMTAQAQNSAAEMQSESEFGDNVDLF